MEAKNIRISPTATIRKTPHDITRNDLEAKDKESILYCL